MSEIGILIVLYGAAFLLLIAEIFIPSHGVLTVAGLGFLIASIVKTFSYAGQTAGAIAVLACLVLLPTFAYVSIKYWPRTPLGRRIAPPNPVVTNADTTVRLEELQRLVGQTGRAVSALRPVGICEFRGRRYSCIVEFGVVDKGAVVIGTGIRSGNLTVQVHNV